MCGVIMKVFKKDIGKMVTFWFYTGYRHIKVTKQIKEVLAGGRVIVRVSRDPNYKIYPKHIIVIKEKGGDNK